MSQKNQIIVVIVLAVVLLGVVVFQFTRKPPSPPAIPKTPVAKTVPTGKAATPTGKATSVAKTAATPTGKATVAKPGVPAGKAATGQPQQEGQTQFKQADVNIDELLTGIQEVDFDYDQQRLARDPMTPLVGTVAAATKKGEETEQAVPPATVGQVLNKVVSGIIWDPRSPVAVVDNEVVYPGYEYADGTTVLSIERDRVIFQVGDSSIEVKLKEQ